MASAPGSYDHFKNWFPSHKCFSKASSSFKGGKVYLECILCHYETPITPQGNSWMVGNFKRHLKASPNCDVNSVHEETIQMETTNGFQLSDGDSLDSEATRDSTLGSSSEMIIEDTATVEVTQRIVEAIECRINSCMTKHGKDGINFTMKGNSDGTIQYTIICEYCPNFVSNPLTVNSWEKNIEQHISPTAAPKKGTNHFSNKQRLSGQSRMSSFIIRQSPVTVNDFENPALARQCFGIPIEVDSMEEDELMLMMKMMKMNCMIIIKMMLLQQTTFLIMTIKMNSLTVKGV